MIDKKVEKMRSQSSYDTFRYRDPHKSIVGQGFKSWSVTFEFFEGRFGFLRLQVHILKM